MINSLVLLYYIFFNNFGLSIIVFTVLVRAAMVPLSVKQSRQMKAMSALQPLLKEIQAKYAGDKQRQSQETMRLYKEQGVNPIGCLGPMIIQMPIFFGLFWALRGTLPSTPERLADLSQHLYSWLPQVHQAVPLDGSFIGMELAEYASNNQAPYNILLPVLVGGSMWLMQKMTTMPAASAQQESTNRMMLWMLPIMFGFFTLSFESGLAVYWIVSNIAGIVIQGFVTGWGPILRLISIGKPVEDGQEKLAAPLTEEEMSDGSTEPESGSRTSRGSEDDRDGGRNSRRSRGDRVKGARRRTQGRRNRRS